MHHAQQSRSAQRFPVTYPVIFGGAPFVGEGTVHDLSATGCAITTDRTVLSGSYVRLTVVLPFSPSLTVDLGKVRWVRDRAFGVEFIRLPTVARTRLDRMVWERFLQSLTGPNGAVPTGRHTANKSGRVL
ncbi:MAG: PilZ domain-containing protein [Nitrospira sp.]